MKKSAWRLALSVVLFACWIGYLGYLAATTTHPIVLSRPQFLSADLYVIANVPADAEKPNEPASVVKVKKVVWSANPDDEKRTTMDVYGLSGLKADYSWEGPGEYILALTRSKDFFTVTAIPRTPGFAGENQGRIYPATPETLRQLELLTAEYHPR
jgi:hypothetical protein